MPSTRECATKRTLLGAGPTSRITSGGELITKAEALTPLGVTLPAPTIPAALERIIGVLLLLLLLPVSQLVNIALLHVHNQKKKKKSRKTTKKNANKQAEFCGEIFVARTTRNDERKEQEHQRVARPK